MAQYDPRTGKVRPTWTLRFTPWWTAVGCLIGGAVTGLLLALALFAVPSGEPDASFSVTEVARYGILTLGGCIAGFLVLGPTLGWGLAFTLRHNTNQWTHILAFAVLGLVVGFMVGQIIGNIAGFSGLGSVLAPFVGIGAATGRWAIRNQARI